VAAAACWLRSVAKKLVGRPRSTSRAKKLTTHPLPELQAALGVPADLGGTGEYWVGGEPDFKAEERLPCAEEGGVKLQSIEKQEGVVSGLIYSLKVCRR
jgi:hypothetical protein